MEEVYIDYVAYTYTQSYTNTGIYTYKIKDGELSEECSSDSTKQKYIKNLRQDLNGTHKL
jgi:hypothetical protein